MTAGGVYAPFFSGSFYGNGAGLTGVVVAGSGGVSTGVVTTAALSGNGNSTSLLGVNSSSVAVFATNGNLVLPYGVVAASGTFSVGLRRVRRRLPGPAARR